VQALEQVDGWSAEHVAVGVASAGRVVATRGDTERLFPWASVTKLATAWAALVAAEEGTLDLDEPEGPPGATFRHLLAHASGLPTDGAAPIARPGERRVYSNTGY
jgi:CubicO group peptidase (beta-lactamase class C family)